MEQAHSRCLKINKINTLDMAEEWQAYGPGPMVPNN
jgi:hypothetical protein